MPQNNNTLLRIARALEGIEYKLMDIWDTPEIKKALQESKARREWIADNIEVFTKDIDGWKFDAMEIRADLILTREKLANLYLVTGNDEILTVMGDLFRAIERIKRL